MAPRIKYTKAKSPEKAPENEVHSDVSDSGSDSGSDEGSGSGSGSEEETSPPSNSSLVPGKTTTSPVAATSSAKASANKPKGNIARAGNRKPTPPNESEEGEEPPETNSLRVPTSHVTATSNARILAVKKSTNLSRAGLRKLVKKKKKQPKGATQPQTFCFCSIPGEPMQFQSLLRNDPNACDEEFTTPCTAGIMDCNLYTLAASFLNKN